MVAERAGRLAFRTGGVTMNRNELLTKLEGGDRAIEEAKAARRRLTRKIRGLTGERLAVLSLLGDGAETSTRKTAPRGRKGGKVRKDKSHAESLPQRRRGRKAKEVTA